MARNDSEHQKPSMSLLFRGRAIFKPLNTVHIDERMSDDDTEQNARSDLHRKVAVK